MIETEEIKDMTKQKVFGNLSQEEQKRLFRESIQAKELLAIKNIDNFLKIIIKD